MISSNDPEKGYEIFVAFYRRLLSSFPGGKEIDGKKDKLGTQPKPSTLNLKLQVL